MGNEASSRKNIAHSGLLSKKYADFLINAEAAGKGKSLVESAHCRRCHIAEGKGNDIAPDLDVEIRRKGAEILHDKLVRPSDYMPDFRMRAESADDIIRYLLNNGLRSADRAESEPYVVFITHGKKSVFEEKCGGCHRLLTRTKGGVGHGETAPNLSGLFSEFYPPDKIRPENERWNREILIKWIKNPRKTDSLSLMPPVLLSSDEEKRIADEF